MTSPVIGTPWKKLNAPVSEEALEGVDKYWRVANYLSIGQIYLRSNPDDGWPRAGPSRVRTP